MRKKVIIVIKWLFPLLGLIIFFTAVALNSGLTNLYEAMRQMQLQYVFIAVTMMIAYWILEASILYRLIKHANESISFYESLKITLAGQFFNGITPFATGGQPAQLYMLHKQKISLGTGASVLTKKFIVYQAVLVIYSTVILAFGATFFVDKIPDFAILGLIGFSVNLCVIGALLIIAYNYKFTKSILVRISLILRKRLKSKRVNHCCVKIMKQVNTFHRHMRNTKWNHWNLGILIFFSLLQLTFFYSIPLVIGYGFHLTNLSIFYMIGAASFVSMVTSFIPLPGAALGAEGSFYLVYQMFFPSKIVIAALLLWRLFTYYLPLLVGGTVILTGKNIVKPT